LPHGLASSEIIYARACMQRVKPHRTPIHRPNYYRIFEVVVSGILHPAATTSVEPPLNDTHRISTSCRIKCSWHGSSVPGRISGSHLALPFFQSPTRTRWSSNTVHVRIDCVPSNHQTCSNVHLRLLPLKLRLSLLLHLVRLFNNFLHID